MSDLVERDAVLEIICRETEWYDIRTQIEQLPSVTQKSGYWIRSLIYEGTYNCSKCGSAGYDTFNYCPNCGCRMYEPQESEDKE